MPLLLYTNILISIILFGINPSFAADTEQPIVIVKEGKSGVNSILSSAHQLVHLAHLTEIDVAKMLGAQLEPDTEKTNQYFLFYKLYGHLGTLSSLDLRIPKSRGGAMLILYFEPNEVSAQEVVTKFGNPAPEDQLQPHIISDGPSQGETWMSYRIHGRTINWIFSAQGGVKTLVISDGR
jgi:hypothetical protein